MKLVKLFAISIAYIFTLNCWAAHCPLDAAAIDVGLSKTVISDEISSVIVELRNEGMALHQKGEHGAAVEKLNESMRLLLNEMQ